MVMSPFIWKNASAFLSLHVIDISEDYRVAVCGVSSVQCVARVLRIRVRFCISRRNRAEVTCVLPTLLPHPETQEASWSPCC